MGQDKNLILTQDDVLEACTIPVGQPEMTNNLSVLYVIAGLLPKHFSKEDKKALFALAPRSDEAVLFHWFEFAGNVKWCQQALNELLFRLISALLGKIIYNEFKFDFVFRDLFTSPSYLN